jgi:hypothetical protein
MTRLQHKKNNKDLIFRSLFSDAEQMLAEKDQIDTLPDDMNIEDTQTHHTN